MPASPCAPARPLRAVPAVLLLVLGLTSCADDRAASSSSSSSSSSPASASPSATSRATASAEPSASPSAGATPSSAPGPDDPLAPQPALETAPPPGQSTCASGDLSVVDADAIVTPDHVHEVFVVRTTGPDCQLEGYPAVTLLDGSGAPLPVRVQQGGLGLPEATPGVVTLSRTTSVSFLVASGRSGSCTQAAAVSVRLPGTADALRGDTFLRVCGDVVGTSPVQRLEDDES